MFAVPPNLFDGLGEDRIRSDDPQAQRRAYVPRQRGPAHTCLADNPNLQRQAVVCGVASDEVTLGVWVRHLHVEVHGVLGLKHGGRRRGCGRCVVPPVRRLRGLLRLLLRVRRGRGILLFLLTKEILCGVLLPLGGVQVQRLVAPEE